MAYPCVIWLKSECDGCGACQEPGAFSKTFNRRRAPVFDETIYENPFYDEEEYF